jgi:hypothetical protein
MDARHLGVNVDAIEQGSADPILIAHHLRERISTFFNWVAVPTARTGVHRGDAYEAGNENI